MVKVENQIKDENDSDSILYYDRLHKQSKGCNELYNTVSSTIFTTTNFTYPNLPLPFYYAKLFL